MKVSHRLRPVFDDSNVVSVAGLAPVLRLAERAGLSDVLEARLSVPSANAAGKTVAVVAGMLAGADSFDDLGLLRHGGVGQAFSPVPAPSTLGTFMREFSFGHVQQLDAAGAHLLAGVSRLVPGLLGADRAGLVCVDVDDSILPVYGHAKQGAAFGYTKVRGLNVQLATISTVGAAPVIAGARLRKGNTTSATGCGRLVTQAVNTAWRAGLSGQVLVRADSAYYGWALVKAAIRCGAWYSVTAKMTATVAAAIGRIDEDAWTAIAYPRAVFDTEADRWVSDAEVAATPITVFTKRNKKREHVTCRLVVRRVRRLQPATADGSAQDELFTAYRYHAFITNSTLTPVTADACHRDHAIIEQTFAELKNGPLAHLPSGKYGANAAWVSCATIAFNLARAAAVAADMATARWATVRTRLINIPARIAHTGRRLILHLPKQWPWATAWQHLWATANGPPTPATP